MPNSNTISNISLIHSTVEGREDQSCYAYMLNEQYGFIAAFDGCESMGNKKYDAVDNHSETYIASRIAADTTVRWFKSDGFTFSRGDAEELGAAYYQALKDAKLKLDKDLPASVGFSRTFATSGVTIGFDCSNEQFAKLEFLYVGNTRGYLLDNSGLCQVTQDDVAKNDAMGAAVEDHEISNILSADGEETLNYRAIKINYPCMLIAATKGAYAPLKNPMYLEQALLQSIQKAATLADFDRRLKAALDAEATDDYAVMVAIIGFDSLEELKAHYADQLAALQKDFIVPFEQGDEQRWTAYQQTYYR